VKNSVQTAPKIFYNYLHTNMFNWSFLHFFLQRVCSNQSEWT